MSEYRKNFQLIDLPKDIFSHKILTREEVESLMPLIRKGDKSARNHLISCNLRLVLDISSDFVKYGVSQNDLFQEGILGLIRATESFDESAGFAFSTYASWWIIQKMLNAIRNDSIIRIPANILRDWKQLKKIEEEMSKNLNRIPSIDEIAERCKLEISKLNSLMEKKKVMDFHRDRETGEEDNGLINRLGRSGELTPDEMAMAEDELRSAVEDLKFKLSKIKFKFKKEEMKIFKERYGLNNFFEIKDAKEIKKKLNLSNEKLKVICKKISTALKIEYGDESMLSAEKWFADKVKILSTLQNLSGQVINLNNY